MFLYAEQFDGKNYLLNFGIFFGLLIQSSFCEIRSIAHLRQTKLLPNYTPMRETTPPPKPFV